MRACSYLLLTHVSELFQFVVEPLLLKLLSLLSPCCSCLYCLISNEPLLLISFDISRAPVAPNFCYEPLLLFSKLMIIAEPLLLPYLICLLSPSAQKICFLEPMLLSFSTFLITDEPLLLIYLILLLSPCCSLVIIIEPLLLLYDFAN